MSNVSLYYVYGAFVYKRDEQIDAGGVETDIVDNIVGSIDLLDILLVGEYQCEYLLVYVVSSDKNSEDEYHISISEYNIVPAAWHIALTSTQHSLERRGLTLKSHGWHVAVEMNS